MIPARLLKAWKPFPVHLGSLHSPVIQVVRSNCESNDIDNSKPSSLENSKSGHDQRARRKELNHPVNLERPLYSLLFSMIKQPSHKTDGHANVTNVQETTPVHSIIDGNLPFLSRIKQATSPEMVFSSVCSHKERISDEELLRTFKVLEFITPKDYDRSINLEHPGFNKLCKEITVRAPLLQPVMLDFSVYFICRHGAENELTRSVIEALKKPILNLTWKRISLSLVWLSKARNTDPFVNDFKDYLREGLEVKIWKALEGYEYLDEVELLAKSCEFNLSEALQQKLASIVMEYSVNLTPTQACQLLCSIPRKSKWVNDGNLIVSVWHRAMKTFTSNMSAFRAKDFSTICHFWGINLWKSKTVMLPLPDEFCRGAAARSVGERWPPTVNRTLVQTFSKNGFVHGDFLDYCIEQEIQTGRVVARLSILGDLLHKPRQFESYVHYYDAHCWQRSRLEYDLLGFAVFGCYPLALIERLFSWSSKIDVWLKDPDNHLENLRMLERLHQTVRVECPDYRGPFPPAQVSTVIRRKLETLIVRSPIEDYLAQAVGGRSFFASRVFPEKGFHIVHLLVRDAAGSLVPFNTSADDSGFCDLEAYRIPSDCTRIAVQLRNRHAFLSDGTTLRGFVQLKSRVMQRLGFDVINVKLDHFERLDEADKVAFLAGEIHRAGR